MSSKRIWIYIAVLLLVITTGTAAAKVSLSPVEELGKKLFFDTDLSTPKGQSCAACHALEVGWTGPDKRINAHGAVYEGAVNNRFGNRKPPSSAYGGDSPVLHYDDGGWIGGMFWDGRATGLTLGDPLSEQAQGPFLNPLEQNNPNAKHVCVKVRNSDYAALFKDVWGPDSLNCNKDLAGTYERIARSIAAYERSSEVSSFTSKFDYYLKDEASLTPEEELGLELFKGKGKCDGCHTSTGNKPLFTDFTYDNLGMPKNPENPFYNMPRKWNPDGKDFIDYGLGGFLKNAGYDPDVYEPELGKMKVPTLRNVDKRPYSHFVKAYSHNGYFKSLEETVHFYNTRDVPGAGWNGVPWPEPEEPRNVNSNELGNLGLTPQEEEAIVAFMKTLSDGYEPK